MHQCCSALQCVAKRSKRLNIGMSCMCMTYEMTMMCSVFCNILQHTAKHRNAPHHTAIHCNTLRHTATHCNTLRHTATLVLGFSYDYHGSNTYTVALPAQCRVVRVVVCCSMLQCVVYCCSVLQCVGFALPAQCSAV